MRHCPPAPETGRQNQETTMSALPQSDADRGDTDHQETREWLDALAAVIDAEGKDRAHFLLDHLLEEARQHGVDRPFSANTAYVNTIEPADEAKSPGNLELEGRLRAYMRWNAMAMVVKANRLNPEDGGDLGGHISSFASLAHMFGAGFNHFWHADSAEGITAATCSTSRVTARPASTPARSWKAGSPKSNCSTSARKSAARACRAIRTRS
jgi:hypothetical protein